MAFDPTQHQSQHVRIGSIKKLLEQKKIVYVNTPEGFKRVTGFVDKGHQGAYKVSTDHYSIEVTKKHRFFNEDDKETSLSNIDVGHKIDTAAGYQQITSIEYTGLKHIVDIEVDSPRQRYYANGFVNHNTGKTLLGIMALIETQKKGGVAVLIDSEYAFNGHWFQQLGGDLKTLIYNQPGYAEQVYDFIESLVTSIRKIDKKKPITIVYDSIAATPCKWETENLTEKSDMGRRAIAHGRGIRKINGLVKKECITMIAINQIRSTFCVDPCTSIKWCHNSKENCSYISSMFEAVGHPINTMNENEPIDVSDKDIWVESIMHGDRWFKVINIVKKSDAPGYLVKTKQGNLQCTGAHKIAFATSNNEGQYTFLEVEHIYNLQNTMDIWTLTDHGMQRVEIEKIGSNINVVDIEVDSAHSYFSDGILSHNSMYGPDVDTVGGKAMKFAASLRVHLKRGKKIEDTKTKKKLGVHGRLVVEKNRIRAPFAESEFDIFFDGGIHPLSGYFNYLKQEEIIVNPTKPGNDKPTPGYWIIKGHQSYDDKWLERDFEKILTANKDLLVGKLSLDTSVFDSLKERQVSISDDIETDNSQEATDVSEAE